MHPPLPPLRLVSVIPSVEAGGIGPACRYAAEALARQTGWNVTLLSLHDLPPLVVDKASALRFVCLGLDADCLRLFLDWLSRNPQDVLISNDVSRLEPLFPFLPSTTRHILQIHDSGRRYRNVAVRYAPFIDGVICVARHIETRLKPALDKAGFKGLIRTIHNGASFPPFKPRAYHKGPLRLLFMGRVEPLKGVFDLVPLLARLRRLQVPVRLNIVGGEDDELRRQFVRKGLASLVTWTGRVPHARCYEIAAESDVLLMPTRREAFGMVTVEAMGMGCVPMAYDIPSGSTEIIENGKTGLLVPLGNIGVWAEQIRSLHANRPFWRALSSAATERARTVFNAESMTRKLTEFARDIVAHAASAPSQRLPGAPSIAPGAYVQSARGYQRLPSWFRRWLRGVAGRRPRICHWWLNR